MAEADCPPTGVLKEGEVLERYKPGSEQDITNLLLSARAGNLRWACLALKEEREIRMTLGVTVFVQSGPAARFGEPQRLSYFVAVADSGGTIYSRQSFPLEATFEGTTRQARFDETLELTIPIAEERSAYDYRVYVGLQLSQEELERVLGP